MFVVKIINNIPVVYATRNITKGEVWHECTDSNSIKFTRAQYYTLLQSEISHPVGNKLFSTIRNYTFYDKLNDCLLLCLNGTGCITELVDSNSVNSRFICNTARATRDIHQGEEIINVREYQWPEEWKCPNTNILNTYRLDNPINIPETPMVTHKMYVAPCSVGMGLFVGVDCKAGEYSWRDYPHIYFGINKEQYELILKNIEIFQPFHEAIVLFANYDYTVDKLMLCLDNERYKNHSSTPEIDNSKLFTEFYTAFAQDVKAHTEIRESYFTYHNCPWANVFPSHGADWIQSLKKQFIAENPEFTFN